MKGKYITTSLLLAMRAVKNSGQPVVSETSARLQGHTFIWHKDAAMVKKTESRPDELKAV